MRAVALLVALVWALAAGASPVVAQTLYSFEALYNNAGNPDPSGTRPDGFGPNGGGTTIARDTIGTTDGSFSIRFSQVAPATFTGAITPVLRPELDDPAVYALVCDVTVPATGAFAGGFARLGITMFGNNAEQGIMGGQAQTTANAEANIEFATPGTYSVTVPLIARSNPITFDTGVPFHTIFGPDTNTQLTPASFQYYINKSGDSALTVYIDNVRVAKMGDIDGRGNIGPDDFALIDRGISRTYAGDSPPGWTNGDLNTDGVVDASDYVLLDQAYAQQLGAPLSPALIAERQARFGAAYTARLVGAVPEPSALGAVVAAAAAVGSRRRRRSRA